MSKLLAGFVASFLFVANAQAGADYLNESRGVDAAAAEVSKAIELAQWSFDRSSLSSEVDKAVVDNSERLLSRSREELAQGNVRTARELVDRAMAPLAAMRPGASAGKHPDPRLREATLRQTLMSMLPEAQRIAHEKRVSDAFVAEARAAVERSDALRGLGQDEAAYRLLVDAYQAVKQRLAGLRTGDDFYLAVPTLPAAEQWSDGLRRIEERRLISQYLLIEAESSGLDVGALNSGIRRAEETVAAAERFATQSQWTSAVEKLELAYTQYEDSWRTAGVEW